MMEVANHLTDFLKTDNGEIGCTFTSIAHFYQGQGLYELALPWSQKCLSETKQRLGEQHPDVATSLNNLAGLYSHQGKYEEAEPLYIEALSIAFNVLGEDHPNTRIFRNNFEKLLKKAIEADKTQILSNDRITQDLLKQLQDEMT